MRPSPAATSMLLALVLTAGCASEDGPAAVPSSSPPSSSSSPSTAPSPSQSPSPSQGPSLRGVPAGTGPVAPGALSDWDDCDRDGFECATLTVPLDDDAPDKGTVKLALTRHRATGDSRIGSLVVNPGGPGGSAVDFLQDAFLSFPQAVRERFDLVAFDPRGVGHSAPVRCLSTRELDDYFHLDPVPDSRAELAALEAGNRKLAAGCAKRSGRVLPYVSTGVVAEDLERVRRAVGDKKLTYLGYSYGTAIGAAYLERFPTQVRAMVLDGAVDPSLRWDQLLAGQSRGFDVALKAFLEDCERTRCEFRNAVKGDLSKAYDALAAQVDRKPLPGDGRRTVGPDEFSLGVGAGLYSRDSGWPAIAKALAVATKGQGADLLQLSDSYLQRDGDGYANISEANVAVNCIDRPWPREREPYQALARRVGKDSPRFGPAIAMSGLICSAWPVSSVSTPRRITAEGSPPVVVIGTTRDPATPFAWSRSLASQLSQGVLLTYRGDGHTVYRNGAPECITRPVHAYLISLTPPAPATC